MTSSMMLVSKLPGMNPAPIPWILWGPGAPPEMTGDSVGSTATICICIQRWSKKPATAAVQLDFVSRACRLTQKSFSLS